MQHSGTSRLGFRNCRTCTSMYICQLTDCHQRMWKFLRRLRPDFQQLFTQAWILI